MKVSMNRLANVKNPYQGDSKKVLTVCSAGLLRSPTAAVVLSQAPYNFNTLAAGISEDFALIVVDRVLLEWADEIVCMSNEQLISLEKMLKKYGLNDKRIICLHIPDQFSYGDPRLKEHIRTKYNSEVGR